MSPWIEPHPADVRGAAAALLAAGAALQVAPAHPAVLCPLRALTGVPCPFCGMTTSVEATLRLDLGAAVAANPAGVAAVLGALLVLALRPSRLRVPLPLLAAALAAMWLFELHRFGFF